MEKALDYKELQVAAMGLAWRRCAARGYQVEIPVVDFGKALVALTPAETFVQFQLWAQQMRTDAFVMTVGFGECAPGYIPTRSAVSEGWTEPIWSWADPHSSERVMLAALESALRRPSPDRHFGRAGLRSRTKG
jgi:hypothetical protein